jgi:hypothetical protein
MVRAPQHRTPPIHQYLAALLLIASLLGGCSLSKEESLLARKHDEIANRKKTLPKGFTKEDEIGVHYYPDADGIGHKQYDEGGRHFMEVDLHTDDMPDKVKDFYEKEIGATSMPMVQPVNSIQRDYNGKHYEVSYGHYNDGTDITIKVSWAAE